uniref:60S ribosomal protein L21 n=1 Tax=Sus scrofa TaxID=9823 RepID=A0A8D1EFE2_PIG
MANKKTRVPAIQQQGLWETITLFPWPHICEPTRRLYCRHEGSGTTQKEQPHYHHGKTTRISSGAQCAVGMVVNKLKGKMLAKKMNIHIENITHSKSRHNFLKCVWRGEYPEKGGHQREKTHSWVQLKHQLTQPRETHSMKNSREVLQLLGSRPYKFMAN